MSLSDGGRGLTQMCKNCLRMEERVKLWTLCLSAKSSDRLSGGTHEAVTRTHSSLKGKKLSQSFILTLDVPLTPVQTT